MLLTRIRVGNSFLKAHSYGKRHNTAVQLVFNPFSQIVPKLEVYSQLQLSLWSDPITFSVPKIT